MSEHLDFEERVVLALLDASGEDFDRVRQELMTAAAAEGSLEGRKAVREYVEALGLLPLDLEPRAPREVVKERLMGAIGGDLPASAPQSPGSGKPALVGRHPRFEPHHRNGPAGRGWGSFVPVLLAACLAVALVGVGVWVRQQLKEQRITMAQLQQELLATSRRVAELNEQRHDVVASLRGMALLAPAAVEVCPLRPVGDEPAQPKAQGSLVMVSQEHRWSVRLHNLEPATAGQVYTLWFLDEENRPYNKVVLGAGDRKIELDSTMMAGKMMTAAAVTLEMSAEVERPTGPQILYGHSREMDRL